MTTAASAWWWNATLPATGRKPPACPGRASMRWGWRICSWRLRNELAHRHSGTVARQQACCTRSGSVAVCTGRTCSYCRRDVLDQTGKVDELGHDHWPWRRLPVGLHDVEHGAAGHRCTSVAVARHPAQRDRRLAVVRLARRRRAHGGLEPVRWAPGRDRRDHHVVLRWWFRVRLAATLPGHGHVPDTGNVQCTAFKHRAAWSRRSRLFPFRHAGGGCVVTDDCAVLAPLAACRQPLRIGLDPTDGDAVPFRLPSSWLQPVADLRDCGPGHPVRSLRIALGGLLMPLTMTAHLRQFAFVIVPSLLFVVLMTLQGVHRHGVAALLTAWHDGGLIMLIWFGAFGSMMLAFFCIGQVWQLWQKPNAELPLLALLPGLDGSAQVKRDLLHAILLQPMRVLALLLLV